MLIDFKTANFKSFLDEVVFLMTPAPKQKGLDYSVLHEIVQKKDYKGLCSAVIYGPNASGKTNIIGAMDVLKGIVLKGNVKNSEGAHSYNVASNKLELIPNRMVKESLPTMFSIKFIEMGIVFEYEITIALGTFLDTNYERQILQESLFVNEHRIFERKSDSIEFFNLNEIRKYLINEFDQNENSAKSLARNSLQAQELFLTNGFKMMFSSNIVNIVIKWFEDKLIVFYRADSLEMNQRVSNSKEGTVFIEKTINEAAKMFGISSNALGYVVPKDGSDTQLCSIFEELQTAIPAELFESYGTVRFINMFPLIIKSLVEGLTLVLDEFDAHIHPMALMNIVTLFHNDDINKNRAQLIFNTHNPIFLNANLFRRDEIKFVERKEETQNSHHYALSDFKTSGSSGVRKGEDYMNKYFIGRYGAIKDVDFYDLFEKAMKR